MLSNNFADLEPISDLNTEAANNFRENRCFELSTLYAYFYALGFALFEHRVVFDDQKVAVVAILKLGRDGVEAVT